MSEPITPEELHAAHRWIRLDELVHLPGNPNQGHEASLSSSVDEFGWIDGIVVHQGVIIAGNHRVDQARARQLEGLPGYDLSAFPIDDARRMAMALAHNHTTRMGTNDPQLLATAIGGLAAVDVGLAETAGLRDLDEATRDLIDVDGYQRRGHIDPDETPVEPASGPPVTKPGDVWELGPHRIMCGDCRNASHVAALLNGATVNLAFTSPPYADRRTYDESSGFKPIPPDEYVDWFEAVQANVAAHLAVDGSWFVNIKEHCTDGQRELYVKDLTLVHVRRWGWAFIDEFCWNRGGVPGRWNTRFKNGWEPVFQFSRSHEATPVRHNAVAYPSNKVFDYSPNNPTSPSGSGLLGNTDATKHDGMALPDNVINTRGVTTAGQAHEAAFPIQLPNFFVRAYTDVGDTVFDPFMGSGSTLLAAHQNDRVGFGMEISPAYCDVIARRWQTVTGIVPKRNGRARSMVK